MIKTNFPKYVQVEPTNYCNLSCPRCPTRHMTYPKGMMEQEVFTAIVNECVGQNTVIKLFFLGEPLLHPDFDAMLIYAATHKVPVCVVTNGLLLTERQIKILIRYAFSVGISIDGTDALSYKKIRPNGNYMQLRRNVETIYRLKEYDNICLTTILPDKGHNEYFTKFLNEWKKIKGVKITGLQLQHHEKSWKPPERTYICPDGLNSLIIRWDGKITYCCGDINGETVLGTILKDKLADVWNGKRLKAIHSEIYKSKYDSYACKKCKVYYHGWFRDEPLMISEEEYSLLTDSMKNIMTKKKVGLN
jgi:radical SAM protein with 4Fe4S-binding SPASM domain